MLMTDKFRLERATVADAKDIWEWRNDPHSRRMFVSSDEVSWETHSKWFEQFLINPNGYLFVGFLPSGEKVGVCRFDIDAGGKQAEVSINLNPAMRGKKLAAPFLLQAIVHMRNIRPVGLTAKVRLENTASLKCFVRCGFVPVRADAEYQYYFLTM